MVAHDCFEQSTLAALSPSLAFPPPPVLKATGEELRITTGGGSELVTSERKDPEYNEWRPNLMAYPRSAVDKRIGE